jgi:hemerythrin-like domain-containing protein
MPHETSRVQQMHLCAAGCDFLDERQGEIAVIRLSCRLRFGTTGDDMTTITSVLTADHREEDQLFASAAAAAERGNWLECERQFDAFLRGLKRHMKIEEDILFPAFEEASGMLGGPTYVMRSEHQLMLAGLEQIAAAIAAGNDNLFRALADSFLALMNAHSAKEERVLYPMCDNLLAGAAGEEVRESIAAALGATASTTPA